MNVCVICKCDDRYMTEYRYMTEWINDWMEKEVLHSRSQAFHLNRIMMLWTLVQTSTSIFMYTFRYMSSHIFYVMTLNPLKPSSGLVHLCHMNESISTFKGVWCTLFIFIVFRTDTPVSKQCRPCLARSQIWHPRHECINLAGRI